MPLKLPSRKSSLSSRPLPALIERMEARQLLSTTVTVTMQVLELPVASVAIKATELGPNPIGVPAAGLCEIVTGLQLSVATTWLVMLGTLPMQLELASTAWLVAQVVMIGGIVSSTVMTCAHVVVRPHASVIV